MKRLSRAAAIVAVIAWLLLALSNVMWTLLYGRDVASAILGALALLIGAGAAYNLGRAVDTRRERIGLLWAGRALALAGAAAAVAFPTVLYGEIVMLAQRGAAPTYDIEAALWHEFWVMPLAILPALVALRWGRIGGILFVLLAIYDVAYKVSGAIYDYFPEARMEPGAFGPSIAALLTGILLFAGSEGWWGESSVNLLRRPSPAVR